MASAPPEAPQTIVLGTWDGIKNTVTEERLQPSELAAAVNVDVDDAKQLHRRRGYRKLDPRNHHSLRDIAGLTCVVRDGTLGLLDAAFAFSPLVSVGPERLAYTNVADVVYFASEVTSGKIVNGQAQPWGTEHEGRWVSPVVRPTETLGAVSGRMLHAPPTASEIEAYSGRIYLGAGRVLWATELYLYDLIDRERNFVVVDDDITMIRAVNDGLYIGTRSQLLFLAGTLAKGLKMQTIMQAGVVPGSSVEVPYTKAHPNARAGNTILEGYGPMFTTAAGICLGLDSGQVFNLTQDRMVFPDAVRAAALYREDQGANAYVAVTDSAGGPSANARIGDYVDAEIVRASQGG